MGADSFVNPRNPRSQVIVLESRSQRDTRHPPIMLTANRNARYADVASRQEREYPTVGDKTDVLHGALDLMVLRALETLGTQHGYGLARRIEQMSEGMLALNQGTLYPALLRLEQRGWISSKWGVSEANRRAKFYQLTADGKKRLDTESTRWARLSAAVAFVMQAT